METIIPLSNFNEPFASSGGSVRAKKRRDDLETQKKSDGKTINVSNNAVAIGAQW